MHERRFHGDPARLRSPERLQRLEVERVVELCLADLDAASALDVGTGTGVFAEALERRGLEVTGIDPDPGMLDIAARHAPGGLFFGCIAEEMPFADREFDLVVLAHVLHETDEPLKALREARRVARQRVVIVEWPYVEEEHGPPLEERLRAEDIRGLVAEAGFTAVDSPALGHMQMYRLTP